MTSQQEAITPLVYEMVESTTPQTTVVDVVLGAFSVVGVFAAAAVLLGLSLGGMMLVLRRWRGEDEISGRGSAIRLGLTNHTPGAGS